MFPDSDTFCGLPPPLSLTETAPPPVERDHVTVMGQDFPAPTFASHVFAWKKGPVVVMPVMLSVVLPTLVSVVVCGGLQTQ